MAGDLTQRLSAHLDRHLVFPLLEFLSQRNLYDEANILRSKLDLLQKTNMVDYAADIYRELNNTEDIPAAMKERRTQVLQKLNAMKADAQTIVEFLSDEAHVRLLKQEKAHNLKFLEENFAIGQQQIDALYHYAKFQFECGNYSDAAEYLYHYRTLATSSDRVLSALWGKLASEILMQKYEAALEDLNRLKEVIEGGALGTPLQQLQQRIWLMHWSLFVFFNHGDGCNAIIDLFFSERYLVALQSGGQALLRYLAAAVVVAKRRRSAMQDLLRVIEQEAYQFTDPLTEFLTALFVHADFEEAQKKLGECEGVMANDFFLSALREEFMEAARLFVFELYCRIHQAIDIRMLGARLNLDEEAAEKWIVTLIRNARLNAKIDLQAGTVVLANEYPTAYDQVLEKAKDLSSRTFALANALVAPRA